MSLETDFGNCFKGEIQSSGAKLFGQEKVSISSGSDTEIQAYVRVSPPLKVRLNTEMGATSIAADCGCPVASRGQLCKHVWSVLLATEVRYPDFLIGKNSVDAAGTPSGATSKSTSFSGTSEPTRAATAKARASAYRKEQYQKQKLAAKNKKRVAAGREPLGARASYPVEVETALAYFTLNGFEMSQGPDPLVLSEAKRKLSRVFHPDKGGTNEEMVELNRNCDLLNQFLG